MTTTSLPPITSSGGINRLFLTAGVGQAPSTISVRGGRVIATNTSNIYWGDREAVWLTSNPPSAASTECATWQRGKGIAQDGIAFRINGSSAVVLERNIYDDAFWDFPVVYFYDGEYTVGQDISLGGYLGENTQRDVFPLRICASITADDVLTFAVAKGHDPMVAVGTPGRGGTINLDPTLTPGVGSTGVYFAHLPPSTKASIDQVTVDGTYS
jgi:hypothetical protein